MDVFHFKVRSSVKKKEKKRKRKKKRSLMFKDKWLFQFPKQFVLEQFVLKHLYVHIYLIRKIEAIFLSM